MGPAEPADKPIGVEVVYAAAPHQVDVVTLQLSGPVTALEAVHRSGLLQRHGLDARALKIGIWGRVCDAQQPLRERDRVVLYRPLSVDPKEARRQRYKGKAGKARKAGLSTPAALDPSD